MENKTNLKELKKKYAVFKDKYGLAEFSELNMFFDIEELEDCETDFFLRRIRKIISERIAGYLRFFEVILNPSNAPIFFFKLIKKLEEKDKEVLGRVYEKLGNLEIEIVRLDLDYSEEKEAKFIKEVFDVFLEIKGNVLQMVDKMVNGGNETSKKEKGSYFG